MGIAAQVEKVKVNAAGVAYACRGGRMNFQPVKQVVIRHRDEITPLPCPYGETTRIVTGGEGGVANVHVIRVTDGSPHFHQGFDEVYYILSGIGVLTIDEQEHELRPGSVAVIPAETVHALRGKDNKPVEFVIFGTPPMSVEDDRYTPREPEVTQ